MWPAGKPFPASSMRPGLYRLDIIAFYGLTSRWCYTEPDNTTLDEDVAWCHRTRRTHGYLQWNQIDCANPQVGCVTKYGTGHSYTSFARRYEWPGCRVSRPGETLPGATLVHYFDASTGGQEFWDGTACAGVSDTASANDRATQLRPGHCVSDCASGLNASARHDVENEWQARGCDAGVRAAGALRQEVRSK